MLTRITADQIDNNTFTTKVEGVVTTDNETRSYIPEYADSVLWAGNSGNNNGEMISDWDDTNRKTFFQWKASSGQSSLQDYYIVKLWKLPSTWQEWQDPAITLEYMTDVADTAKAKIKMTIEKNGVQVYDSSDLAADSWTTLSVTKADMGVWAADDDMVVKIRVFALDDGTQHIAKVSTLKINYKG